MSNEKDFVAHRKDFDTSSVWYHYLTSKDGKSAKCKKCSAVLKTLGGSTKGLHTHLSAKHSTKVQKECNIDTLSSTSQDCGEDTLLTKKRKINDYFSSGKDSLDLVLSRMTAKDGFSFNVFITSTDLRNLLKAKGYYDLPTSAVSIRNRVVNYSSQIRELITKEIQTFKNSGKKFSLTFDEWTSTANKRYMNINIHSRNLNSNKFWNLGLMRIHGSFTAKKCVEMLTERLNQYDISLEKDIVAIVTDGPNVMLKVGKEIEADHQLCFVHGIHLAISDALYDNKLNTQPETSSCKIAAESCHENETLDLNNDDDDESSESLEAGLALISEDEQEFAYCDESINELIKKVRKLVIYFKRSPTRNAVLQNYVRSEKKKELSLLLDCKTRWNSLVTMLERFYTLKNSIQKAVIDLKPQICLENCDYLFINEIVEVLKPIQLTVEALCRRDSNLLTADAALKILLGELIEKKSKFASQMTDALKKRIRERRSVELSGVLAYLHNPKRDDLSTELASIFSIPTKNIIKKQIKTVIERLNKADNENSEISEITHTESAKRQSDNRTYKEKLQEEIEKSMLSVEPETQKQMDLSIKIRNEMSLFENGGVRGHHLELVYQYLLTICPASVEAERSFSAAGFIANKIRSRLGDDTLDALILLRSYFQRETD